MLRGLWNPFHSDDKRPGSHQKDGGDAQPSPRYYTPSDLDDGTGYDAAGEHLTDDEIIDRMLVRFPSYGTHSQALEKTQPNPLNPTADWLLGGTGNIPNPAQQLKQKQMQQMQQQMQQQKNLDDQDEPEPTAAGAASTSPTFSERGVAKRRLTPPKPVYKDWDVKEQQLWTKTPDRIPKKEIEQRERDLLAPKLDDSTRSENESEKNDDPEQDWLYPYYYHLGVFPKAPQKPPVAFQNQRRRRQMRLDHSNPQDDGPNSVQDDVYDEERNDTGGDNQQFVVVSSRPENSQSAGTTGKHLTGPSESAIDSQQDDRQHWMPDQLCNRCYSCDSPFTVFRRRHHCRLCGQVFCNTCAGFFAPANHDGVQLKSKLFSKGLTSQTVLRTCKFCYDQVAKPPDEIKKSRGPGDAPILEGSKSLKHPMISPSPSLQEQLDNEDSVLRDLKEDMMAKGKLSPLREEMDLDDDVDDHDLDDLDLDLDLDLDDGNDNGGCGTTDSANGTPVPSSHKALTAVPPLNPSQQRLDRQVSDSSSKRASHKQIVEEGNKHMGRLAASHLEQMGAILLKSDAPLLGDDEKVRKAWLNRLLTLATKCCATIKPDCKNNDDLLDIRPYCKIKVIPGGSLSDCAYISGVMFRKMLIHKNMTEEILEPRIMILNGDIEFTRAENRITSLDTLLEQESRYMEILVGRILKLKPDILIVGRSVSRKAQELLLAANVVLLQHVQASLLKRISRQTGATIISSTDHIMNQFGSDVLGKCHRFRFVVARDNEIWTDEDESNSGQKKNIKVMLNDMSLNNHERQSVLAANMLGEDIMDGALAVKCGLAKRGVARTYIMLEGCPKHLGCTVILRGASRAALKQVKVVFRFLINVAYNLHLETTFFKERCARINENFRIEPRHLYSSSLCVDYGNPPDGRKIWPWNGDSRPDAPHLVEIPNRSLSGEISAFDHQAILITSIWMTEKTQCCTAEVKGICFYSIQDVSLGQFLRDSCFNLSLKCQNLNCKNSVLDHSLSFVHKDGIIKITVDYMAGPLPPGPSSDSARKSSSNETSKSKEDEDGGGESDQIATWTFCSNCDKVVTPLVYISDETWKYSFGKFLESIFYNRDVAINSPDHRCSCPLQASSSTLFFGCGRLAARFNYERIRPYSVFVQKQLPIDTSLHRSEALMQLSKISMESSQLFVKFDKHIEKVSREARSLFGSAANRPEHLQTVLSELNRINTEVEHASNTLQEKIASVSDKCSKEDDKIVNEALFRFPWFARRYLYMLTAAWNEKLSAAGQAIVAMKKLARNAQARGDSVIGPNVPAAIVGDDSDELKDGMRRLRQLHEVYSRYNLTDITTILPRIPGLVDSKDEIEYDDDFEDPDGAIDFAEGVDADVLASRRRLNSSKPGSSPGGSQIDSNDLMRRPTKSLGTNRPEDSRSQHRSSPDPLPNPSTSAKVTPGGAVKSALTRLFNRGGRELDPYVVDLGIFNDGRPRLEPGCNGIVVPVFDEQPSTVIAYSLSSTEYANQFQYFSKNDHGSNAGPSESALLLGEPSSISTDGPQPHSSGTPSAQSSRTSSGGSSRPNDWQDIERQIVNKTKTHIKHTFRDFGEKRQPLCKFVCTTYWATQFHAVRKIFLSGNSGSDSRQYAYPPTHEMDVEQAYIQSLSNAQSWAASGGKSGASFARTSDGRFVIKCISKTELQMFLENAPAYFEYLNKIFFHNIPTVLCKIVGVYHISYHNRVTGKRTMDQVAVMQNIFYKKKITKIFDLKGSRRGRFAAHKTKDETNFTSESTVMTPNQSSADLTSSLGEGGDPDQSDGNVNREDSSSIISSSNNGNNNIGEESGTLLDGDFLEYTCGRPMPMDSRANEVFQMSISNDTFFLSIINVLDYSILVGIDEENNELVVGIIDFMRQYDIMKQMERVGKSLPMVVGSEAPTIIQPPLYKKRFLSAMNRYFMTVPNKWTEM